MKIPLTYISLTLLFIVAVFFVRRIDTPFKLFVTGGGAIAIGLILMLFSKKNSGAIIIYIMFFLWILGGTVIQIFGPRLSKFLDEILCKLSGQQYHQMKDDSLDDNSPEISLKFKWYVIAIVLYVFFLMAVLPGIL